MVVWVSGLRQWFWAPGLMAWVQIPSLPAPSFLPMLNIAIGWGVVQLLIIECPLVILP